jgi:hypothetical protein
LLAAAILATPAIVIAAAAVLTATTVFVLASPLAVIATTVIIMAPAASVGVISPPVVWSVAGTRPTIFTAVFAIMAIGVVVSNDNRMARSVKTYIPGQTTRAVPSTVMEIPVITSLDMVIDRDGRIIIVIIIFGWTVNRLRRGRRRPIYGAFRHASAKGGH